MIQGQRLPSVARRISYTTFLADAALVIGGAVIGMHLGSRIVVAATLAAILGIQATSTA